MSTAKKKSPKKPESVVVYQIYEPGHSRHGFLLLGKETDYAIENKASPDFLKQRIELPNTTPHKTIHDREEITKTILRQFGFPGAALPHSALFADLAKLSTNQTGAGKGMLFFSTKLRKSRGKNIYGTIKGGQEKCDSSEHTCIIREIQEEVGDIHILPSSTSIKDGHITYYLKNVSNNEATHIERSIQARLRAGIGELEDLSFKDTSSTITLNGLTKSALKKLRASKKLVHEPSWLSLGGGKRKTRRRSRK